MRSPKLWCKKWWQCRYCLDGGEWGSTHAVLYYRELKAKRERESEMGLKRPDVVGEAAIVFGGTEPCESRVLYPLVCEYLTADRYEDGSARRTSTITIFAEGRGFKGSLNDRDLDRVAFASSTEIEGLLALFEAKLKESSLDWRVNGGNNGKKPRRGT